MNLQFTHTRLGTSSTFAPHQHALPFLRTLHSLLTLQEQEIFSMARLLALIILLISFLLLYAQLSTATCYYPDGETVAPHDLPCLDGPGASACCGYGYACLSNRLCMQTETISDNTSTTSYVRGSCTDQKWHASECPAFCIGPKGTSSRKLMLVVFPYPVREA